MKFKFIIALIFSLLCPFIFAESKATYTPLTGASKMYDKIGDYNIPSDVEQGPKPTDLSWTQITGTNLNAVATIDDTYYESKRTEGRYQFDFQLFEYVIQQDYSQISDIELAWYGYGEDQEDYDCYFFVWNFTNQKWELLSREFGPTKDLVLLGVIEQNISDYISDTTSPFTLYTMTAAQHYNYPPEVNSLASPGNNSVFYYNPCDSFYNNLYRQFRWNAAFDPDYDLLVYEVDLYENNGGWADNSGWITDLFYWTTLPSPGTGSRYFSWRTKSWDGIEEAPWTSPWGFTLQYIAIQGLSSCPFVYSFNGNSYKYESELPTGKLDNYSSDSSSKSIIKLNSIKPDDKGSVKIKIREVLDEVSYLDNVQLIKISCPEDKQILLNNTEAGNGLYTASAPFYPLNKASFDEEQINLEFGPVETNSNTGLLLTGWNVRNTEASPADNKLNASLEQLVNGSWNKVCDLPFFYGDTTEQLILLPSLKQSKKLTLRISGLNHNNMLYQKITSATLYNSLQEITDVEKIVPSSANLFQQGNTKINISSTKGPRTASDESLPVNESFLFSGTFTKYGKVTPLLTSLDDNYVIMRHGDSLELTFDNAEISTKKGEKTIYILQTDLFYKTASISHNSTPLPYHKMKNYPYSGEEEVKRLATPSNLTKEYYTRRFIEQDNKPEKCMQKSESFVFDPKNIRHSLNTNHANIVVNYQEDGPPSIPELFSPEKDATAISTSTTLYWFNAYGTTPITYQVQVSTTEDFSSITINDTNLTDTNDSLLGLAPDTLYFWRVRASNSLGASDWSDVWRFDTGTLPTTPTLEAPSDEDIGVSVAPTMIWSEASGTIPITYSIQVSLDNTFTTPLYEESDIEDRYVVVRDLEDNTLYYWRVRAENSAGNSDWSTPFYFTTGEPPSIPELNTPTNSISDVALPVTVTWKPSTGTTPLTYSLQLATDNTFESIIASYSELQSTSYYLDILSYSTTYYWRVKATNSSGESQWSGTWTFSTQGENSTSTSSTDTGSTDTSSSTTSTGITGSSSKTQCFITKISTRKYNSTLFVWAISILIILILIMKRKFALLWKK